MIAIEAVLLQAPSPRLDDATQGAYYIRMFIYKNL